jgi:hypothetical protein
MHVVEVNTGGIGEPIELAVLEPDPNGQCKARKLTENELEEHRVIVTDAYRHLAGFTDRFNQDGATIPD